ncbi:MAG: dihydropyrimidinase [Alphaproteobacteria bacterium]
MPPFDLVIRGGEVVTASERFRADIGIKGGRIAALGEELAKGADEIDARGKLVMPGGIDAHCHIEQKSSVGLMTADDFFTGTRSAACGGTTTVIPFAAQHRGMSLRAVVKEAMENASAKATIDYALHMIVSDPTEQVLGQELPALIRDGITSFKIYMTYDMLKLDDKQILDVMAVARREGGFVMVHAENWEAITWLSQKLLDYGHSAPKFHAVSRPMAVEREATHRAIMLSELVDVPILIVHVSGAEAIEQIRWAQSKGLKIYAETCTQYLALAAEDLDQPGLEGARHMCSPPPRERSNQPAVWNGLKTGVFQVLSSDHAPFRYDSSGKLAGGPKTNFKKIANGVPGLEVRLPILFSEGVGKGRIDIHQFVAVSSTNPARLYGLAPRKGSIAVGGDADIAIWDPNKEVTISQDILHDNMDYTPYAGIKVTGWPVITLSRGEVVCRDMEFLGKKGRGQYLPRELSPMAQPLGRLPTGFDPHTGVYKG